MSAAHVGQEKNLRNAAVDDCSFLEFSHAQIKV